MRIDAFVTKFEENKLYDIVYYHSPTRWIQVETDESLSSPENWSDEIKFLHNNGIDVSEEIKNLPADTGGIYMFFIKGIIISHFENYLAYIGRAQYTNSQNLKARCISYYYEFFKKDRRPKIARLIEKWGPFLYLRYYSSKDNDHIQIVEKKLINAILPPFNDEIPDVIYREPEPAF